MKKQFLILAFLFIASVASAQEYKKFKLGSGLGWASQSGGVNGVIIYGEPAYRINDAIAIGLRLEAAGMAKVVEGADAEVTANVSTTLNGQYYLSNNKFRPFVGAGMGFYRTAGFSVTDDGTNAELDLNPASQFGFYPRVGFDYGHLNFTIDYNIVPSSEEAIGIDGGGFRVVDVKNSYLSVKLGISMFGGKI